MSKGNPLDLSVIAGKLYRWETNPETGRLRLTKFTDEMMEEAMLAELGEPAEMITTEEN